MLIPSTSTNKDSIIASLRAEKNALNDKNLELLEINKNQAAQIVLLEEQIRLANQKKYGKQTEQTSNLQMMLFDEFPEPEQEPELESETITYTRKKTPKSKGRKIDTSKCSRERIEYDLDEGDKKCSCGHELSKIGEDTSEQVDYVPASIKVIEHARFKYCCKNCQTIKSADKPEQPLGKCMATEKFVADVIINKYQYHLPLYRQSKMLAHIGADIPDNTLGNWVMHAADALYPLSTAMWEQINTVKVLQADESPVKILEQDKKGYMWGYHSCDTDNRFIMFEYSLSRGGEIPENRLSKYTGILQTDGYGGYNVLRANPNIINIGCWDHCRRKFADAIKVNNNNKTGLAGKIFKLINKLYDIERDIKYFSFDERYKVRQDKSKPILTKIYKILLEATPFPKSLLGKAVTYAINNKTELIAFLEHGEVEISNCWMENQIRPLAIGRKNWMFVGNVVSANKAALLYSLIQTCILNNIDPRTYLVYVLQQAHKLRRKEIDPASILPQFIDKALLQ